MNRVRASAWKPGDVDTELGSKDSDNIFADFDVNFNDYAMFNPQVIEKSIAL